MRFAGLSLAASILMASSTAAPAVEMIRPFEVLEQTRRAMMELDKRQKGEIAGRQKQEKEQQAGRRREEAEQRKREREEKVRQEAQRRRDAAPATAAQGAGPPSTGLPPQPSAAPALADQPGVRAPAPPPQATRQAAERQPPV
jgi:hypothetical protein